MDNPKVSVVIPCYNQASYLQQAIDSVLTQIYPNIELIVVNDGSTDNTKEICLANKNVIYVEQPNSKVASARQKGFDKSSGDYVMFLDSDDLILPSKIERQVRYLEKNRNYWVVFSNVLTFKDNTFLTETEWRPFTNFTDFYGAVLFVCLYQIGSALFKRECIESVPFKYTEDYYLDDWKYYQLLGSKQVRVGYVNDTLTLYRRHSNSATTSEINLLEGEYEVQTSFRTVNERVWSTQQHRINSLSLIWLGNRARVVNDQNKYKMFMDAAARDSLYSYDWDNKSITHTYMTIAVELLLLDQKELALFVLMHLHQVPDEKLRTQFWTYPKKERDMLYQLITQEINNWNDNSHYIKLKLKQTDTHRERFFKQIQNKTPQKNKAYLCHIKDLIQKLN